MKTVIMAGGKGSRISSVASDIPKPLIEICGKPVLQWEIESLVSQGFSDIIITVSHMAEKIRDYFGDGGKLQANISYFHESKPLGNAGALFKLRDEGKLDGDFLLLNADSVFDIDFNRFVQFHKEKEALVTLFTHPNSHPYDSGLVITDENSRVTAWLTKEEERPQWYKNRVNAGLHIINTSILDQYGIDPDAVGAEDENGNIIKVDLDRQILKPLAQNKGSMFAYDSPEYVKDMGTPERLEQVRKDFKAGLVRAKNLSNPQKAVFLDRDGTINKYVGFLRDIDDFELLPGVEDAIKIINQSGDLAIVVSNQPVVARGEASVGQLNLIHNKMETLLGDKGAYLDAIYYCPHHPDKGFEGEVPELKTDCDCRKPKPGMLLTAAEDFNIDLSESWMVGDSENDVKAGKAAGCRTALIGGCIYGQDILVDSLLEFIRMAINYDAKMKNFSLEVYNPEDDPKQEDLLLDQEIGKSGYIHLKNGMYYSYDLSNYEVILHLHRAIPEIEGTYQLLTEGYDRKQYLIFSQIPFKITDFPIFPQNYRHPIDWIIKDYRVGSRFSEVRFSFDELQYFCPSTNALKIDGDKVTFDQTLTTVKEFDFCLDDESCKAGFYIGALGSIAIANSNMRAVAELKISFRVTDDLLFIEKIYHLVDFVFSFICNRRNTTCTSMTLKGVYPIKSIRNHNIVNEERDFFCKMFFMDKYREPPENHKEIARANNVSHVMLKIEKLFQMVADELSNHAMAQISISSIHPSVKRRGRIDLQQSLELSSAFEFYVRKFLPKMRHEKEHVEVLRMVIEELKNVEFLNKKARKDFDDIGSHLGGELSLSQKIEKVYFGYDGWDGLKTCIEEWFPEKDIPLLGKEANEWRNELAHEKREYVTKYETITAVRLIEHLNYGIVLRQIGFRDSEIHELLGNMLVR